MKSFSCLWFAIQLIISVFTIQYAMGTDEQLNNVGSKRDFSFLTIVTFKNEPCTFVADTPNKGVCYPTSKCTELGGTSDGNCASGFGVCCKLITNTCGDTVSNNCTYLQNPSFPSTDLPADGTTCSFTISTNSEICQLRLDFATFELAVPAFFNCVGLNYMEITDPTAKYYPLICGKNNGMHIYTETGRKTTGTVIKMSYDDLDADTPIKFNIKVSFIPCTASYKAPTDCNQYFTANTAAVQSYGFQSERFLYGYYSTCIRQNEGMCQISWMVDPTENEGFQFQATTAVEEINCSLSYIQIPSITTSTGRICGTYFGFGSGTDHQADVVVVAFAAPFLLYTVSQFNLAPATLFTGAVPQPGYKLIYNQLTC